MSDDANRKAEDAEREWLQAKADASSVALDDMPVGFALNHEQGGWCAYIHLDSKPILCCEPTPSEAVQKLREKLSGSETP